MKTHPKFVMKYFSKNDIEGWYFNLTANNGQTVATSEIYTTKAACECGISTVRENAPIAEIEDLTDVQETKT